MLGLDSAAGELHVPQGKQQASSRAGPSRQHPLPKGGAVGHALAAPAPCRCVPLAVQVCAPCRCAPACVSMCAQQHGREHVCRGGRAGAVPCKACATVNLDSLACLLVAKNVHARTYTNCAQAGTRAHAPLALLCVVAGMRALQGPRTQRLWAQLRPSSRTRSLRKRKQLGVRSACRGESGSQSKIGKKSGT